MKTWLFRRLFAAEYARHRAELAGKHGVIDYYKKELAAARALLERKRPPALISIKPRMSPEAVAEVLAGAHAVGHIQAVIALMEAAIVENSNRTGEEPSEGHVDPGSNQWVPGFTEAQRTHAGGAVDGVAKVLQELQRLTAAQPESKKS